jgi:hypothetical protein
MPLMPAMIPFAWRRPSMNRAGHDDLAAVAVEEALASVQSLLGEEDIAAPAHGQRAAAEVPDGEADVVAQDGRCAPWAGSGHEPMSPPGKNARWLPVPPLAGQAIVWRPCPESSCACPDVADEACQPL